MFMTRDLKDQEVEIVEIYVPRRLEYLSELYRWLREQFEDPYASFLKGFSIYEVSGAYVGTMLYTEQTMVVRLIFELAVEDKAKPGHEDRINHIADNILRITEYKEEEVWLMRTQAIKTVCTPPTIS
jgi:hypothetical protein